MERVYGSPIRIGQPADGVDIHQYGRQLAEREAEERREIKRQIMLSMVPPRFRQEDGLPKGFGVYHPRNGTQVAALAAAQQWVAGAAAGEPALTALIGPTGVGKSHLLYAAAWELFLVTGKLPYCIRWYRFADELRYGRGSRDERGNPLTPACEIRREWHEAPVCLIDEARATSGTELDATELAKYALHSYDERTPVLITTNMANLESLMGEAPANRFRCVFILGDSERGT
jgi:DNA replication protein DnaC